MRANAPFPVLLALTGVVYLLGHLVMPATLLASPMLRQPMRSSVSRSAKLSGVHSQSHSQVHSQVHRLRSKANSKQHAHSPSRAPSRRHIEVSRRQGSTRQRTLPTASTPAREDAASRRVHAWMRTQHADAKLELAAPKTKATMSEAKGAASSAEVMGTLDAVTPPPVGPFNADGSLTAGRDTVAEQPKSFPASLPNLPVLYNKRGRLIVPPALKGSHEILIRQNVMADSDGLERVRDDEDLTRMRNSKMLIAIPASASLHVDERLPANRRYIRPWTALFLDTLARQHSARFQTPLQVNSAVRTVEFQQRLIHSNGNAAPAEGDTASPHLTGQAVDIAKRGLTMTEIAWLRGYLLPLVQQGKVDVEEEFQQSCFHISVYKKYMPQVTPRAIATTHREGMGVLGMSLR